MDEQEHYDQRCSTLTLSGQCAPYSLRNTLNHRRILAFSVMLFIHIEFHYVSKLVYILVVLYFFCPFF